MLGVRVGTLCLALFSFFWSIVGMGVLFEWDGYMDTARRISTEVLE